MTRPTTITSKLFSLLGTCVPLPGVKALAILGAMVCEKLADDVDAKIAGATSSVADAKEMAMLADHTARLLCDAFKSQISQLKLSSCDALAEWAVGNTWQLMLKVSQEDDQALFFRDPQVFSETVLVHFLTAPKPKKSVLGWLKTSIGKVMNKLNDTRLDLDTPDGDGRSTRKARLFFLQPGVLLINAEEGSSSSCFERKLYDGAVYGYATVQGAIASRHPSIISEELQLTPEPRQAFTHTANTLHSWSRGLFEDFRREHEKIKEVSDIRNKEYRELTELKAMIQTQKQALQALAVLYEGARIPASRVLPRDSSTVTLAQCNAMASRLQGLEDTLADALTQCTVSGR